jgi:hypothetical protein
MEREQAMQIEAFAQAYEDAGLLRNEIGIAWQAAREGNAEEVRTILGRVKERGNQLLKMLGALEQGKAPRPPKR